MAGILDSLMGMLGPQVLGPVASQLGESTETVQRGLQTGSAAMLAGLAAKGKGMLQVAGRNEIVILIRPYVLNTASEAACATRSYVDAMSIHPAIQSGNLGNQGTFLPHEVPTPNPPAGGIPCRNARMKSSSIFAIDSSAGSPASCRRKHSSCVTGSFNSVYAFASSMPNTYSSNRSAMFGNPRLRLVNGHNAAG